jgi:AraC family transcriptional regulator
VPEIPAIEIDLARPPRVVQTGLCLHGVRAAESFRLRGSWSLHAYHYRGEIRVRGRALPFGAGWVSLIPPDTLAEWHFPSHAPHHYVHFALEASGQPPIRLPVLQDLGDGFDSFCAALEELIQYQRQDPLRAAVRLWDLLHGLRGRPDSPSPGPRLHPSVQIALSLIHSQQSERITVGEIARAIGVSHNHLTQVFQKSFGCGVRRFIQRERVARACHLLSHSSLSVKSIALETGIPDLQYFNKLIRRATGLSPRAYRGARPRGRQVGIFQRQLGAGSCKAGVGATRAGGRI